MNMSSKFWATTVAILVGGLLAAPSVALAGKAAEQKVSGTLHVYDGGKLFTDAGIDKAKAAFSDAKFEHGLILTIDTYKEIPEDRKGSYKKETDSKFFKDWALSLAKEDRAKGIYVLVCRSPGFVEVLADKTTRERGFSNDNEQKLRNLLLDSFKDAKTAREAGKPESDQFKIRDSALLASVSYVITDLKDTSLPQKETSSTTQQVKKAAGGMSVGGWICIGLCVLLGVWLVIGLIRAFTGGGGGGGGGYGGGGGGGGGGFMTGLLGGMFGAMAGMWLYNSVFGGHSSFGSDAYAGDGSSGYDSGGGADTSGDGDFSGDAGAGGGYDDGPSGDTGGGGDFGGGGGDYGGGGDFGGGGGGDFGGGDF
jgi:uncharacterized protein